MIEFVEECRKEWKRLRVPDPIANEMAADLEVDLREADADGASAEEVLGSAAFDPRSFAAAWASARGVVPGLEGPVPVPLPVPVPVAGRRSLARPRLVLPFALSALAVLVGAVFASRRSGAREVFAMRVMPRFPLPGRVIFPGGPGFASFGSPGSPLMKFGVLLLLLGVLGLIVTGIYALWVRSTRPIQRPFGPSPG